MNTSLDLRDSGSLQLLSKPLGIVFFWFGALKLIGMSPAQTLATALVQKILGSDEWARPLFLALALLEVAIGACFFFRKTMRLGAFLLFLQMPLTFLPLLLLREQTFAVFPWVPTLEGQYILKNLVLVGAGIVLVRSSQEHPLRVSMRQFLQS